MIDPNNTGEGPALDRALYDDPYDGYTHEDRLASINRRVEAGELDPEIAQSVIDDMSKAVHYEQSFTTADANFTWLLRDQLLKGRIDDAEFVEAWNAWTTHKERTLPVAQQAVGQAFKTEEDLE